MKAVVFDCFGVLYVESSQAFFERELSNYEQLRPLLVELESQTKYGLISRKEWQAQVVEVTGLDAGLVSGGLGSQMVRNQQLVDYLIELRSRSHRVGLASNIGMQAINNYFNFEERQELFDAAVISGEVGVMKPDLKFYQILADRLDLSADKCMMVDDSSDNCHGARSAGMQAIEYSSNQQTIAAIEQWLLD